MAWAILVTPPFYTVIHFLVLDVAASVETIRKVDVHAIGEMTCQQVVYERPTRREDSKDSKKIYVEDRAALMGVIGKTGGA